MRFPLLCAVALVLSAAVPVGAAEQKLPAFLPAYSAMAAGVDLNALCDHPQSANLFAVLENICGKSTRELAEVLLACDPQGKRRIMLAEFDRQETVANYCGKVKDMRLPAEDHNGYEVFLLKGRANERKAVRMLRFTPRNIGLFTAFPSGAPFRAVPGKSPVFPQIPRRKNVLLWGWGKPQIDRDYLRHIREFYFVLEPDIHGNLLLHGRIRFTGKLQTVMFLWFVQQIMPAAIAVKYDIPIWDVWRGISALDVKNTGEEVVFSCRDIEPVFKVFTGVFHRQLSKLREITQ
ncbi:MAG: hypothetical protein E7058_10215 [Lentisphaerae bacterium]|nr:hypothetical protein [Lentisphaerota bacterium]